MKKTIVFLLIILSFSLFADPPNWQQITGTQYSMLLRAQIFHQNSLFENNNNNIVAAFGPNGEDDCRAIGFWIDAYPPYYDEGFWHLGIVSNLVSDEEITFKIYDTTQDQIFNCIQTIIFTDNITIGSPYNPYIISTSTGQIQGIITLEGNGEPGHVQIETSGISTNPQLNSQGNWEYTLELPPGIYDIQASMLGYQDSLQVDIPITSDQTTENVDFFLYQSETPLLYVPEFSYGALNQDIHIPIYIDIPQGTGIEGINIGINYDEDILDIVNATLSGGILEDENYNFGVNATIPGQIQLGFSATNDLFCGDGIICFMNFLVNQQAQPGDHGTFEFSQSEINEITVPSEGGIFTILNSVYYIGGNISYFGSQLPIENTELILNGDYSFSILSDIEGDYAIENIPDGDYALRAEKSNELGGLSGLDASRVFRYSLGLYDFQCSQMIAADVTLDGSISGTDASRIARFAAGLIDSLNQETHWIFIPEEIENCNEWPPIEYETLRYFNPLDTDQMNQDFIGIRLGDVSGNWSNELTRENSPLNREDPEALIPQIEATEEEIVTIPITANNLQNLEGLDVRIDFNPQIIAINNVTLNASILEESNFGLEVNNNVSGQLTLIFYANSDLFTGSGIIANIEAQVTGNAGNFCDLVFEMFAVNEIDYLSNTTNGSITIVSTDSNDDSIIPNKTGIIDIYPNPFNPKTEISFFLEKNENVDINIYNIRGRLVKTLPINSNNAGINHVIWDGIDNAGRQVTSGLYIIELKGNDFTSIKKGMLLK